MTGDATAPRDGVSPRLSRSHFLAWIVCAGAAVFILVLGGGYLAIASLEGRIALQLIAVIVLGSWLLLAVVRPAWRPATPLLEVVLLAAAAYGLSALLSQRPRLSLEPTIGGLGFAIAFLFLTRVLREPWFRRRAVALVIGTVAFVAIGYIVQVVIEWIEWWQLIDYVAVPPLRPSWAGLMLGTPNLVAAYLLIAGPLALALLRNSTSRRLPVLGLGTAILAAVFLTGARSAYLALGVAAVAAVALASLHGRRASWRVTAISAMRRRPVLIAVPLVGAVGGALLLPSVLHRFAQGGDTVRLDLWRAALEIFMRYPLTGGGPGTWVQLKVEANAPDIPNLIFANAHNTYVQAAAELGIMGIAAAALLIVVVARRILRGLGDERAQARGATLAVIAGLVAFATLAAFDSLTNMPVVCLLVIGVVAWVDSALPGDESAHPRMPLVWARIRGSSLLPAVGILGILVSIPTLIRIDSAWSHEVEGNRAALVGDWSAALAEFDRARTLDPELTLYSIQVAGAQARLGRTTEAMELLGDAIELDPVAVNQIGAAALAASLGRRSEALAYARRAVELGARESTIALNAGLVGEGAGDISFALEQFANAVAWNPPLAGTAFWDDRERSVAKGTVIDAAVRRAEPLIGALVLAYAGRTSEALAVLERQPPSQLREIYRAVAIWRAGGSAHALAALRALLVANPLDWVVAGWIARIARISGDLDAADLYARWALIVQGDSAPSVILEVSSIPPLADGPSAGLPRSYPTGVYSRPTSPYLLMPQLVTIGAR